MEYIKPKISIEHFEISENITAEGGSTVDSFIDDLNENGNDFNYELNAAFSEAFGNIFP